jgi:hypothetical protein
VCTLLRLGLLFFSQTIFRLTFSLSFSFPEGTIGMEILKSMVSLPLDYIFVCCGGGGLLAGIAAYVKRVRPNVKVIGVEAADAAGMTESIKAGRVVTLDHVGLFADGAAVRTVGDETYRICSELVDDMVTVDTDQICNAIKLSYNDAYVFYCSWLWCLLPSCSYPDGIDPPFSLASHTPTSAVSFWSLQEP